MVQQIKLQNEDRLYSPSRDLAHNYPEIMLKVFASLSDRKWRELEETLQRAGVDDEQVDKAYTAIAEYFNLVANGSGEDTWLDVFYKSGFLSCDPVAQVAIFAEIGKFYSAMFFAAYQDAFFTEESARKTLDKLVKAAERIKEFYENPSRQTP